MGKVSVSSHSITGMNTPVARAAPPKMYSRPRPRVRTRATTAVMMPPNTAVTGRPKVRNHPPPVTSLMYSRYTPMAAKPQGTKTMGLGRRNHRGSTSHR